MRALVLSGGAAAGAYEAGVAYALTAAEQFDLVCGTSIGAINAGLIAQGLYEDLRGVWASIAAARLTRLRPELEVLRRIAERVIAVRRSRALSKVGASFGVLGELRHIREAHDLARVMSLLPWDPVVALMEPRADLMALRSALILCATNLTRGRAAAFYAFPSGQEDRAAAFREAEPSAIPLTVTNYVGAVCASAALPPAFEPVWLEDVEAKLCAFADGFVASNTPIRQAIDGGATDLTVVFMDSAALRTGDRKVSNMADIVLTCSEVAQDRIIDLDLKLLRSINDRVMLGTAPGKRFINTRIIGPSVPLGLEAMDFDDQAIIDRVFALGVGDGEAAVRAAAG